VSRSSDIIALQDPPERGGIERKARALAKAYWRGRGEEITKEQEDEFWLSFAKDASLIPASDEAKQRDMAVQGRADFREALRKEMEESSKLREAECDF
jgi:hypothetical protein